MYSSSSAATPTSLSWGLVDNEGDGDGGESMTTFWEHKEDDSSIWNNSTPNSTIELELPIDMQFNAGHVLSIVVYSVLFVLSAIGNLTVLIILLRRRKTRLVFPPMDFLLLNLAVADLMVTMFLMPLEVAWNATVTWRGGDLLCRVMAFFRIFGLFLSSFVLVCLAVDRYMAVRFPMQSLSGVRRSRQMIALSWILSVFCSSPQVVFFQVEHHPVFTWYTQCVVYSSLPTKTHTFAYFLFGMFFTYLGPFIIILILYCGIVIELIKRHKESKGQMNSRNGGDGLRRSGIGNIGKAKEKALKMTAVIIIVFFVCWTPYFLISLWYFIDEDSFSQLDPKINKALFFFACTNSTANPVVYGIFRLKSNTDTLRRDNNGGTLRQGISGESLCQRHLHSNNSFRMSEVTQDQSVTIYTPRKSTINVSIMQQPKESQGCNLAVTASTSNHAIKGVLTPSYV